MLLREADSMRGPTGTTKSVEYDAAALAALHKKPQTDTGKVMNLLRDLRTRVEAQMQPAFRGLLERAERVREAFEERQLSTKDALAQIEALAAEEAQAEAERKKLGLDEGTFAIYWTLEKEKVKSARDLALELAGVFTRFPNFSRNADELRELKAEIYKALLKEVTGKRMVEIGDRILSLRT
jgi:type I restriction enzyme R subunit